MAREHCTKTNSCFSSSLRIRSYCTVAVGSCWSTQSHTCWRRRTGTPPRTVLDCSRRRCPASPSAYASRPEGHVPRCNTFHCGAMRNFMNEQRSGGEVSRILAKKDVFKRKETLSFCLTWDVGFLWPHIRSPWCLWHQQRAPSWTVW